MQFIFKISPTGWFFFRGLFIFYFSNFFFLLKKVFCFETSPMNRSHREVSKNTLVYPGLVYPFLKKEIEKTNYSFLKFHPPMSYFQKMQFIFKISPSFEFFSQNSPTPLSLSLSFMNLITY